MSITVEKEIIEAIAIGLPSVKTAWGFLEFESALVSPSFPTVTVTRVNASLIGGEGLKDMCDEDDETSDTLIQVDAWDNGYEDTRNLNEQVHAIVNALVGPEWQSESDVYTPAPIRAWRISSIWKLTGPR